MPPSTSTCCGRRPDSARSRRCWPGRPAIVDHHESPNAIEGSLDVIADACAEVGVRVVCAYGVTDRHGADGARRGLAENERFLRAGGRGLVGVHAAFTCSDETLDGGGRAGRRSRRRGPHPRRRGAARRRTPGSGCAGLATDDWLLVHCVRLDRAAARHDRPQPAQQHEQRRRLRPPGRRDRTPSCSAPTASAPTCSRSSAWPTSPIAPTTWRPRRRRRGRG